MAPDGATDHRQKFHPLNMANHGQAQGRQGIGGRQAVRDSCSSIKTPKGFQSLL